MRKMKKLLLVTLSILLLLSSGCTVAAARRAQDEVPAAATAPEPKAASATDLEARRAEAKAAVRRACAPDFSSLNWDDSLLAAQNAINNREALIKIGRDWKAAVEASFDGAHAGVPTWQTLGALYGAHREGTAERIRHAVRIDISDDLSTAVVFFPEVDEVGGETARFSATFTLAYLNTIYDNEGAEKSYEHYPFPEGYLDTVGDPLPGRYIKDGWYLPRSQSTRKHTGTDIRALENENILSCTDGTVKYIGYNGFAGNYVVVEDDCGFEYHYYHMCRMTDFLKVGDRVIRGEVVGHVGNTGNSDADHLHLTVVSPAFTFINPYPMLREVRRR